MKIRQPIVGIYSDGRGYLTAPSDDSTTAAREFQPRVGPAILDPGGHCQRKILNTRGGYGTPWINPEKSREINGGEIRSRRAGKVFDFSLTMPLRSVQAATSIGRIGLESLALARAGCPLWVISGLFSQPHFMSALPPIADINPHSCLHGLGGCDPSVPFPHHVPRYCTRKYDQSLIWMLLFSNMR